DLAQTRSGQQLVFPRPELQDHVGSARLLPDELDGVVPFAGALPSDRFVSRRSRTTAEQNDALRDDEGRIEADSELADELRLSGRVGGQALKELACSRLGDRADVIDDFLP